MFIHNLSYGSGCQTSSCRYLQLTSAHFRSRNPFVAVADGRKREVVAVALGEISQPIAASDGGEPSHGARISSFNRLSNCKKTGQALVCLRKDGTKRIEKTW